MDDCYVLTTRSTCSRANFSAGCDGMGARLWSRSLTGPRTPQTKLPDQRHTCLFTSAIQFTEQFEDLVGQFEEGRLASERNFASPCFPLPQMTTWLSHRVKHASLARPQLWLGNPNRNVERCDRG